MQADYGGKDLWKDVLSLEPYARVEYNRLPLPFTFYTQQPF